MSEKPGNRRESAVTRNSTLADDARAVRAVLTGDSNSFGELVQRYQKRLYNLSLMVLRNPEFAEENTQDAFVRAYEKLDRYDIKRPFYPWLATIAVRLAQTQLRKKYIELEPYVQGTVASIEANPLEHVMRDKNRELWELVTALPSGERTAVFLVYRQELSLAEAASIVGVTTGTIKTLLYRARKKLRTLIDKGEEKSP